MKPEVLNSQETKNDFNSTMLHFNMGFTNGQFA